MTHVKDIREQFPMRLTETLEIAAGAGIRHPWDNRSWFREMGSDPIDIP